MLDGTNSRSRCLIAKLNAGLDKVAASGYLDTLLTQAGSPTEPNTKGTTVKMIDNKHVNNYETSSCDGGRRLGYD